jgi:hypothetical protein
MAKTEKERAWTQRMGEWARSGMSRRAWCAANEVSVHTFDYWRRRLRTRTVSKSPPRQPHQRLVPVIVKSATVASESATAVEIALPSGIALRAATTVEARWLATLVREIEAC